MMKMSETALASENHNSAPSAAREHRPPSQAMNEGLDELAQPFGEPMSSLALSALRESLIIDRSGQGATLRRGNMVTASTQVVQIIVLANSDEEREHFLDRLAARVATELTPEPGPEILEIGELRIHAGSHRVHVSGREIFLTKVEYKLLLMLAERRDHVLGRNELLREVWAVDSDTGARRVDIAVRRLRVKLGSAARFLQTLRGFGYRFSETPPA